MTRELPARLALVERAWQGCAPPDVLEEALGDEDVTVRARAAIAAAEILSPERLVELIACPPNLPGRSAAMVALKRAGERSLQALVDGVRTGFRDRAIFCLQVLGRIRSPVALEVLREAAGAEDVLVAQAAIEALGQQQDRGAVPMILAAVERGSWLAFAAITALSEIGDDSAIAPLKALRERDPLLVDVVDQALTALAGTRGPHA